MKDQEAIISSYDIVNNGHCPFCNNVLISEKNSNDMFEHSYCINGHMKVMYDIERNWRLIRVNLKPVSIAIHHLYYDRMGIVYENFPHKSVTFLPYFDIFSYSFVELNNKIKLYSLFS